MEQKKILLKGKNFFYRTKGEGEPVILLHGFAEDSSIWDRQFNALQGHRLIIPDLPGSGQSEMTDDMSMEGLAETIHELLRTLTIERCTLIGHSMGGYVTLAFVEKYAEVLHRFGLFQSTAYPDSEEKKETRKKGIEFISKHGAFEFLKTSIPNLYSPKTKAERPQLIEEQIAAAHGFSNEALIAYYNAMIGRPDRLHVLKETKLPVLFVMGRFDTAAPIQDGLKQCYLPSLSHVHILENSGHMGMREETEQANQILNSFLVD